MSYRCRERVARALDHQQTDRIPYDCLRTPEVLAVAARCARTADERECYTEGDFEYVVFHWPANRAAFDAWLPAAPKHADVSEWGFAKVALKSVEGFHAGHKTFHPLARVNSVADLDEYPFPDATDPRWHESLESEIARAKAREFTVVGQMSQTILETAYELRGLERLMMDLVEQPEFAAALFEKLAERRRFQARRFAEAGADILRIGDDIATQRGLLISPALYRKFIKPLHASVIQAARRVRPKMHVLYHSDGNLTPLLPDLIEIGVTAINPVQPECMSPLEVKHRFGRDLTLWGCAPVQSVFQQGGEADVRAWVETLVRLLARDGGLVVNFINFLATDRSLANMGHFFEVFYDRTPRRTADATRAEHAG
jgi:uroporphyrinogen decarboxylase